MSRTAPERRFWRPRAAADGVYYAAARSEEVLAALPVAAADRAAAAGLPPWRAVEHTASRTLLRALLREVDGARAAEGARAAGAFVDGARAAGPADGPADEVGGGSEGPYGGCSGDCPWGGCSGEGPYGGPVAARPGGRPYLPGRPGLGVSLSHSSGWVAAAVGRGRDVGVDVQVPAAVGDRLLRFCCAPEDADALTAMAEERRRREFAWIFTAQEACVKAVGAGFAARPWAVRVSPGQCAGIWHRAGTGRPVRWRAPRERQPVPVACAWTERPEPPP
ncbi:4'-phosphopantetheinyl transferase family protein [Streptomyces roseicoloratus]|uniref:4'-phosphopantetheinyl transferase family protein n=1 Tax=Streptomyces roseicoloratus TaxID=2508722 RepID=UPI0024826432|nr:4'-phosphopantetheinyl transferase superfamily protein [Streptomyces roseicoloratus]